MAPIDAILADGKGGFWLGGQTALAHWHAGVSQTYPIEGSTANSGTPGILSLHEVPMALSGSAYSEKDQGEDLQDWKREPLRCL